MTIEDRRARTKVRRNRSRATPKSEKRQPPSRACPMRLWERLMWGWDVPIDRKRE